MIVKVQLSLDSNVPGHKAGSRMMVYNQTRSVMFEREADPEVVKKMKGRPKTYFNAEYQAKKGQDGRINILDEAPWQDW